MASTLLHFTSPLFRIILSLAGAFFVSLALGPKIINQLQKLQLAQKIYEHSPATHQAKRGTPTMGGVMIIFTTTLATILFGDLSNVYLLILLLTLISFGVVGVIDDYSTVKQKLTGSRGLSPKVKYACQSGLAIAVIGLMYLNGIISTKLLIPFCGGVSIDIAWLYFPLAYFMLVGTSNAVNLTDGLDGLAIVPTILVVTVLGIFAFVAHDLRLSANLSQFYLVGILDVVIFCAALVGSGLGFLWFNAHPAKVFMGDVGSLSIGATLGVLAIMVKQELILLILGGIFVLETVSVIIQVLSMKIRKKRVFKMAPIHHHFELSGWPETVVVLRFWIISILLAVLALISLFF